MLRKVSLLSGLFALVVTVSPQISTAATFSPRAPLIEAAQAHGLMVEKAHDYYRYRYRPYYVAGHGDTSVLAVGGGAAGNTAAASGGTAASYRNRRSTGIADRSDELRLAGLVPATSSRPTPRRRCLPDERLNV